MITDEKIKEAKRKIKSGAPAGEVKEELIRAGYSEQDLAKLFAPHPYDMRTWYLVSAIIVLLLGVYFFLKNGSLLLPILSALLFAQYTREQSRIRSIKNQNESQQ
ncbi:MAG: hypothetical protein NVV59_00830 [Chitinophagaceae bacterium]|nr:hypothetical protein [Chitinophagaceae bacterium]